MFDFIAFPMGQLLYFLYNNVAFHRYGLAIIVLTLIIRLCILPLYVKQYRSMSRMQEVQPLIQEIQKRYKTDKEKLNQELMKVYSENKVNPAGGCLPLLIQMPILYALFFVISQPLKFMLNMSAEKIGELASTYNVGLNSFYPQIQILNVANNEGHKILDMSFLGLNLGLQPTYNTEIILSDTRYAALLVIPLLAAATTYLSTKFSTPKTNNQQANDMQNSMQRSMMIMMPIMIAFFSFSAPAGLGLYWIIGNVIQVLQQLYMNKYIIKKKEVAVK